MKRSDIEVGRVYGQSPRRTGIYRYEPVIVISADLFMIPRFGPDTRKLVKADDAHTKITTGRRGLGNAVGLLMVTLAKTDHDTVRRVRAAATVEGAMAAINGAGRAIMDGEDRLGSYWFLTDPRELHGDYYELTDALEARARRSRELSQQHEESRLADLERYRAITAGLGNLGVMIAPARPHDSPALVKLTFDQAERLLDLLSRTGHLVDELGIDWGKVLEVSRKDSIDPEVQAFDVYVENKPGT